ncbi:MAG: PQQ-dependent sugar dehydrogenase [Chitinophagaceae bacterium]|nr:PQQ-dependent sugar dehydrogenase [Chitinophagaceae bacterium]MBP6416217.1 PQQ-dependent sugar dehydrogenase [Chitinophagaceae bacterium]
MKMVKMVFAAAGLLFVAACSSQKSPSSSEGSSSVETLPPNSPQYKPAFVGQTRITSVKTGTAYSTKVITRALEKPWSLAALPDGRFLVTEKEGSLRIVNTNGTVSNKITGVPTVDAGGQGGLLGVALDPDYANNRMIYFVFSEPVTGGNHAAVAKARLTNDETAIENVTVIYRVTPTYKGRLHNGGKLAFNKDGHLFVSTGERSDMATRPLAQDNTTSLGKIVLITKTGQAVTDPLMLPKPNDRPEIFSSGHRNPLGIAIHPTTGDLWEAEMGPRGGDEINIIRRGKNYGWPVITYGIEYSGQTIGQGLTQKDGYEQPLYYWDPSISPGGIAFYTGTAIPEWQHNLFVASLSGKHIIRLALNGNKVTGEERLLASENQRFRDVCMGKDGKLYAITDDGRMYSLGKE